jgi:BirA family biotin operon repressor/biotin-[acetyl-CoA-carboxylase] ligase
VFSAANRLDEEIIRHETGIPYIEVHQQLASTNDRAIQLARVGSIELPAVIAAQRQTGGRGQFGRVWLAADGSLTFSLLIDMAQFGDQATRCPIFSMASANAVALSVEKLAPQLEVQLKWPNDVYVDGRKLAGVLLENVSRDAYRVLVIGVGVNVNNSLTETQLSANTSQIESGELIRSATSMIEHTAVPILLDEMLVEIVKNLLIELWGTVIDPGGSLMKFEQRSYLRQRRVRIETKNNTITGQYAGLGPDGQLRIQSPDGLHSFVSGHVVCDN